MTKTTLALAALVMMVPVGAQAAVLCKTRSGTVKIRDVCRSRETVIDPATLGLQGPPGPRGLVGPPGGSGAVVKDANDATVGTYSVVWDASSGFGAMNFGIAHDIGGVIVGLTLPGVSSLSGTSMLVYTSTDCSGPAFIIPGNGSLIGPSFVDGTTLYYASGAYALQAFSSFKLGINPACSLQNNGSTIAASTATEDLSGLVPPYHVDLTP